MFRTKIPGFTFEVADNPANALYSIHV